MLTNDYKKALLHIANQLNHANIRWTLGAGCLLYFYGLVESPTDIDIIVHTDDHELLQPILFTHDSQSRLPHKQYRTKYFYEMDAYGVDIDIMIDFTIATDKETYHMPFVVECTLTIEGTQIPLGSLAEWNKAYQMMNRQDKAKRIQEFLSFQLNTERLQLRHLVYTDLASVLPYASDEQNMYYERSPYNEVTLNQQFLHIIPAQVMYAIVLTETNQLIGHLYMGPYGPSDFHEYSIGYILHPIHQGFGYCTEAVIALMDYAFNKLHAHRISARCNPENIASWHVMEKVGLRREGRLNKRVCFKYNEDGSPIWWDEFVYGITKDEWVYTTKRGGKNT